MNIMRTSDDPESCAWVLCDQHVIKLTVETAQMLSAAVGGEDTDPGLYRATHRRHPCTVWASTSRAAFLWLVAHGVALAGEYQRRFGRVHRSLDVILRAAIYADRIPDAPPAPPPLCVSDDLRDLPLHDAYQLHLRVKHDAWTQEGRPPRWTRTTPPPWATRLRTL